MATETVKRRKICHRAEANLLKANLPKADLPIAEVINQAYTNYGNSVPEKYRQNVKKGLLSFGKKLPEPQMRMRTSLKRNKDWRIETTQQVLSKVFEKSKVLFLLFISVYSPTYCYESHQKIEEFLLTAKSDFKIELKSREKKDFFNPIAEEGQFLNELWYDQFVKSGLHKLLCYYLDED